MKRITNRLFGRWLRRRDMARQMQARADEAFGGRNPTWCMEQMLNCQRYRWRRSHVQ